MWITESQDKILGYDLIVTLSVQTKHDKPYQLSFNYQSLEIISIFQVIISQLQNQIIETEISSNIHKLNWNFKHI